jgi:TonB family protein
MKSDVKREGFDGPRGAAEVSAGGLMLKGLLIALTLLPLSQTPARARQDGAPSARTPAPSAPAESEKWERFTYPDEEFSVEMPLMPFVFHTTRHVNRTLSDREKMRVFGVYSGGVVFMVASYDKPRDGETFDDFAGYTQGGSLGGLVSKGNVTLKGFAGKEYAHPDGRGAVRVYRAKKKAYFLKAYAKTADDPKVARFLDSFSLERKTSGVLIDEFKAEAARVAQAAPPAAVGPGRVENSGGDRKEGGGGPEMPVDYNRTFRQGEVTRKALILYKPEPGFTEEARRNGVTGVVRLRAVLSSKGRMTNISVIKPLPAGLTEKAIYTARHILFFPAMKDGREVSQFVILEYNFNIY